MTTYLDHAADALARAGQHATSWRALCETLGLDPGVSPAVALLAARAVRPEVLEPTLEMAPALACTRPRVIAAGGIAAEIARHTPGSVQLAIPPDTPHDTPRLVPLEEAARRADLVALSLTPLDDEQLGTILTLHARSLLLRRGLDVRDGTPAERAMHQALAAVPPGAPLDDDVMVRLVAVVRPLCPPRDHRVTDLATVPYGSPLACDHANEVPGLPNPRRQPRHRHISTWVTDELHERVTTIANARGVPVARLVNDVLASWAASDAARDPICGT